ncbi:MAG: 2-oxo acid dehydrogenase subunit E2, partial [Firmicutes bacterium]|nr:2-oxo acid dehydrogenase subunit E2 [Bacillota bacterium]
MAELESMRKIPLTPLRRIIRDRMNESAKIPQFSLEIDVEMAGVAAARERTTAKPSVTACLLWCCARALREVPELNGFFLGEETALAEEINLGVAVSVPGGLIVPIIRRAEAKSLNELAAELASLIERARKNRLSPDDLRGGTFTLSNLGMFGIKKFAPLLNPPQLAIIGVGNCASSLAQGIQYYRDAKEGDLVPGLMHVNIGPYHIRDIEIVCAFDVDADKVGRDVSEAIFRGRNNTIKISDVPPLGAPVY